MNWKSKFLGVSRVQSAIALCIAASSTAWADHNPTEITITAEPPVRVSGFDGVALQELPLSVTSIGNATLRDIGAQRVTDALRTDASVSDSYNLPAYWDKLSVRGFALDNRYNFRREGLPISAETIIPMDNKERIELLKGTSGIQSGTSAPGGLVNYVVKRSPNDSEKTIRDVMLSYGPGNNRLIAADLGGRFGEGADLGYRFNVAHEDLNPYIRDTKGQRDLVALAMDWRLKPGTVIDFEFEQSHREQIGINGYSLLGGVLPAPVDPRINLTRQPWALPGVFDAMTGSVRLRQELDAGWQWTTQYGAQRLKTDDRLIFGYGCTSPTDYTQYCGNGDFTLYDYRSNNERRLTDALESEISGQLEAGGLKHTLVASVLRQRQLDKFPTNQSYAQIQASGNVATPFSSSPNPDFSTPNSNRSEYATELSLKDRVELTKSTSIWAGLRHVMFDRSSERNDPGNPNSMRYTGHINAPWLGVSTKLSSFLVYASHGHGVENFVVPNSTSTYWVNAGQQLGVGRSRQTEMGLKSLNTQIPLQWHANIFQIERPLAYDDGNGSRLLDGKQTHRGIELGANSKMSQWTLGTSVQWLHAQISDVTQTTGVVGSTPLNVPKFVMRGMAEYRYASVPGLRNALRVSHEGERRVTEDGSVQLPAWTTLDASAHYDTKVNNVASTWTLAIDNVADKRYWRESPKQFGHYYLYPGAPRTLRASVQFRL